MQYITKRMGWRTTSGKNHNSNHISKLSRKLVQQQRNARQGIFRKHNTNHLKSNTTRRKSNTNHRKHNTNKNNNKNNNNNNNKNNNNNNNKNKNKNNNNTIRTRRRPAPRPRLAPLNYNGHNL